MQYVLRISFILLMMLATSANAGPNREARCDAVDAETATGGYCGCSEPLDNQDWIIPRVEGAGSETWDPSDSEGAGAKECGTGGEAFTSSKDDGFAASVPAEDVPSGSVGFVYQRQKGLGRMEFTPESSLNARGPKRVCWRKYIRYDPTFPPHDEAVCRRNKGFHIEFSNDTGLNQTAVGPEYQSSFQWVGDQGNHNKTGQSMTTANCKNQWCRMEMCVAATSGVIGSGTSTIYAEGYMVGVEDGRQRDLTSLPRTHTGTNAFSVVYHNPWTNGCSQAWTQVSYLMQAEWDTDNGQWIGAASEVEGGAATWNVAASLSATSCTLGTGCDNIDVTLTGTGSETGNVTHELDCNDVGGVAYGDGVGDPVTDANANHIFNGGECDYNALGVGTYTISVRSTRNAVVATDTTDFTVNAAPVKSVSVTINPISDITPSSTQITAIANNYAADPTDWVFECNGDASFNDTCDTISGTDGEICDCPANALTTGEYTVGARETNFHPDANATDTTNFSVTSGGTWEIITVTEGPGTCDDITGNCQIDVSMFGSGNTDALGVVYELDCDASDGIDYADGNSGSVTGPNYTFTDGCDYTGFPPDIYVISGRSTDDGVVDEQPGCEGCTNQMQVQNPSQGSITGASFTGASFQ